jgi:hypothetical protein
MKTQRTVQKTSAMTLGSSRISFFQAFLLAAHSYLSPMFGKLSSGHFLI